MKIKKCAAQLSVLAALMGTSVSSFAASCDQLHPHVIRQQAAYYQPIINAAAQRYRINPALITAVITAESCFRNEARSHKGAGGLMQLIPATARRFGVNDRFDPEENIEGGTRYLRWLLNRYNGSIPHAIAAYNAGEGRVDEFGVHVPFEETQTYTRRVLNAYSKLAGSGQQVRPQVQRIPTNLPVAPAVQAASDTASSKPSPWQSNHADWDEYASD